MSDYLTALDLYDYYRHGLFPMAETAADKGFAIIEPRERALLPIADLHIPQRLERTVKQFPFRVTIDTAFDAVISACAAKHPTRPETWINQDIKSLFLELHQLGLAHSVECWSGDTLAGGLYGLEVGAVFCGESMFSRQTDASKVSLVHLCARLWQAKFTLLDAQFHNPHLEQFGLYTLSQENYVAELSLLRDQRCDFKLLNLKHSETELIVAYLENRAILGDSKTNIDPAAKG